MHEILPINLALTVRHILSILFCLQFYIKIKGQIICPLGDTQMKNEDSPCRFFQAPYPATYVEASEECKELGTRLAVVKLNEVESNNSWLADIVTEEYWIDGTSSEPEETGNKGHMKEKELCKLLHFRPHGKKRLSIKLSPCSKKMLYLCERHRPDVSKGFGSVPVYALIAIGSAILLVLFIIAGLVLRNTWKKRQVVTPPGHYVVHPSSMTEDERDRISTLSSLRLRAHIPLRGEAPLVNSDRNREGAGADYHDYCEIDLKPWPEEEICGSRENIIAVEGGVYMIDNETYGEQYPRESDNNISGHYDVEKGVKGHNVALVVDNNVCIKT